MPYHDFTCPICKYTSLKRSYIRTTEYFKQKWKPIGYYCFKCGNTFEKVKEKSILFSGEFCILSHPDTKFVEIRDITLINYNFYS